MFKKYLLATLCLIFSPFSNGAIVTYAFEAQQSLLSDTPRIGTLADTASAFTEISGVFSYNTTAVDIDTRTSIGEFNTGLISINEFLIPTLSSPEKTVVIEEQAGDRLNITIIN